MLWKLHYMYYLSCFGTFHYLPFHEFKHDIGYESFYLFYYEYMK
ncbi:hypothetical protein BTJ45_02489 [Bacillus mycoides]|nr:hypothetical protein BTJ45_02489 [Bacillus mycoides]